MKFRLHEAYSKTMPTWLRQQFDEGRLLLIKDRLDDYGFDFANAKFVNIPLPSDAEERVKEVRRWIEISKGGARSEDTADIKDKSVIVFISTILRIEDPSYRYTMPARCTYCPGINDFEYIEGTSIRFEDIPCYPQQVLAACYATDWKRDEDVRKTRSANAEKHHQRAMYQGAERYDYQGARHTEHILPRPLDASGYIIKPPDYYENQLLSHDRKEYVVFLNNMYERLSQASKIIRGHVDSLDWLHSTDLQNAELYLSKLESAVRRFNALTGLIEHSQTEDEIDELFEPNMEASKLRRSVKELVNLAKQLQTSQLTW